MDRGGGHLQDHNKNSLTSIWATNYMRVWPTKIHHLRQWHTILQLYQGEFMPILGNINKTHLDCSSIMKRTWWVNKQCYIRRDKKILEDVKGLWAEHLHELLWSYNINPHSNIKEIPCFTMVYDFDAMLPVKIDTPTWRFSHLNEEENETKLMCIWPDWRDPQCHPHQRIHCQEEACHNI